MSTAKDSERMPAASRRSTIHPGVGAAGSTPRTTRATKRSTPLRPRTGASSAKTTGNPSGVAEGGSAAITPGRPGSRKAAPVECEYSRATPRIEKQ